MEGHPNRPSQTSQEWLRYASGDLQVAERELRATDPIYHTVCFLCQSAAEKFLKGYLISKGWQLEKTHDIVVLLEICASYEREFEILLADGAILNEFIIAGRYPGDISIEPIGTIEAEDALAAARRIRNQVIQLI